MSVSEKLYAEAVADRRASEVRLLELSKTTIALDAHHEVIEQMQRQIDSLTLAMRHNYVPREVHNMAVQSHNAAVQGLREQLEAGNALLRDAQAQLAVVTKDAMTIKRHDMGMAPTDVDYAKADPMYGLGQKTQDAIDAWADGNRETRNFLIHQAHMHVGRLKSELNDDMDAVDAMVAKIIQAGDG